MFKKIELWVVLMIIIFILICSILFGSVLRYHYNGGKNFTSLRNLSVFFAEIPSNIKNVRIIRSNIYNAKDIPFANFNNKELINELKNKQRFKRYLKKERNEILVLPRYDGKSKRSVVEIIDLNDFKVIHKYSHDVNAMNNLVSNNKEHSRLDFDDNQLRLEYRHPLILKDGSLVSDSDYSPLFKLNFCSELEWINDVEKFHHSKMLANDGNIWVPSSMNPYSDILSKHLKDPHFDFYDDAITKVNQSGKIIFQKSISEILIENKILSLSDLLNFFTSRGDPVHLNDIEEAKKNSLYWNKGDLFLSSRHLNAVIHYRPSNNEVIKYIKGPFYHQHDVDIISDKEISIFNNNEQIDKISGKNSNLLIYNFENKSFYKILRNN